MIPLVWSSHFDWKCFDSDAVRYLTPVCKQMFPSCVSRDWNSDHICCYPKLPGISSCICWYSVKRHDDTQLCNALWCDGSTFPRMRSICTFCVSISFPMSSAMLFRFPMMLPTWDRFSSISSSRASLVTLRVKQSKLCLWECLSSCLYDWWLAVLHVSLN